MIIGIGSDLCDIRRIEKALVRHGDRFTHRVFTPAERDKSNSRKARAASFAKQFAAKEALAKALGVGINKGVYWRDIGVVNLSGGKPSMHLSGGAKARLNVLTPSGQEIQIHLTITDEFPLAQAFVILYAVPKNSV